MLASCSICLFMSVVATKLEAVFPPGGQRGTIVQVTVTAKTAADAELVFSDSAIQAKRVEKNVFAVTIGDDARLGIGDVRLIDKSGLSTPQRFLVSALPAVVEKEGNETEPQQVSLPCVVDAKFAKAADVDRFSFEAQTGVRIVVRCRTESVDGMAQPALSVFDPDGVQIASHFAGHESAFVFGCEKPGNYQIEVVERAYRGGDKYRYRIELFDTPTVITAFPPVLQLDKPNPEVLLFQLGSQTEPIAHWKAVPSSLELAAQLSAGSFRSGDHIQHGWEDSESFRFTLTDLPVTRETAEPNNEPEQAQKFQWPGELVGQFLTPADRDWYQFEAKKGQKLAIQVWGERLGSALDLDLAIHDDKNASLLTLSDSTIPKGFPTAWTLSSTDPAGSWTAPRDGRYFLVIRDLFGSLAAGPERQYRICIRPTGQAVTAYALEPADGGWAVPKNGSIAIDVACPRWNGYTGPIVVRPAALPDGFSATPVIIPEGAYNASVILTATDVEEKVHDIRLEAAPARAGNVTWTTVHAWSLAGPAGEPRECDQTVVLATAAAPVRVELKLADDTVLPGKPVKFAATASALAPIDGKVTCEWVGLTKEMKGKNFTLPADTKPVDVTFETTSKLQPGQYAIALKCTYKPKADVENKKPATVTAWSNGIVLNIKPKSGS